MALESRLTSFDAQVSLLTAQTNLRNNHLERASAELVRLQERVPRRLVPVDLPLLRASESLDVAKEAAATGRPNDLRTQLLNAQAALHAYAGPHHPQQVKALAAHLAKFLNRSGPLDAISVDQLSIWQGEVGR